MKNISLKVLVIAAVAIVIGSSSSMARDAAAERFKLDSNAAIAKTEYQTISNASRARHDIAMNAIRNIKG